eukprot:COSAG01_NODE_1088_length_11788_cov_12.741124_1_plen_104_part_00
MHGVPAAHTVALSGAAGSCKERGDFNLDPSRQASEIWISSQQQKIRSRSIDQPLRISGRPQPRPPQFVDTSLAPVEAISAAFQAPVPGVAPYYYGTYTSAFMG